MERLLKVLDNLFPADSESKFLNNKWVKGILYTILSIALFIMFVIMLIILFAHGFSLTFGMMLFTLALVALIFLSIYKQVRKKKRSPVLLLIMMLYGAFITTVCLVVMDGFQARHKKSNLEYQKTCERLEKEHAERKKELGLH